MPCTFLANPQQDLGSTQGHETLKRRAVYDQKNDNLEKKNPSTKFLANLATIQALEKFPIALFQKKEKNKMAV